MPSFRNPTQRGDLFIKFEINFPEKNFLPESEMKVSLIRVPQMKLGKYF